jgi:threo-3-hydroxy-L-aspartate ammonia-lyase
MTQIPSYDDVAAAAQRIEGIAYRTPTFTSRTVDRELQASVFFKCENFQRAGAFKFRGAYNALVNLTEAQRRNGVLAFSSGNHAQAIALAGSLLDVPASVLMPSDAPTGKVQATREYGARVLTYDRYKEDRAVLGRKLADEGNLTLIPPFDHPHIIAGQGTAAKELLEEVGSLDALFVPVGGGGLLSGCILASRALAPQCKLYGVEPEAGNDAQRSLQSGSIVHIDTPHTIADGAQSTALGQLTFQIIKAGVSGIRTVSDHDLKRAMQFFFERMKMAVEPTGCLAFAAARNLSAELRGLRVGIIVSGGNVDAARFSSLMGAFADRSGGTSPEA